MTETGRNGVSIAILAGGESTRMGADKALRLLGGKALAQHVIDAMRPVSDDIYIVGNDVEALRPFGLPVCGDLHGTRSSLVGVYAAIAAAHQEHCLVVSCDMPFADPLLALRLLELAPGYDAVVPVSPAGMEPLFAVYSRGCLEAMAEAISEEDYRILKVLDRVRVRWVTPAEMRGLRDPELTFFNANTPEDLRQAESLLVAIEAVKQEADPAAAVPLVCFVGNKNSGKTTLIAALVDHLSALGMNVACIKHDVHGFSIDHEGTDTYRFDEAGAGEVIISSPRRYAHIARVDREADLGELRTLVDSSADIILAEGYKSSCADKIEVHGDNDPGELVCDQSELLAVVSDTKFEGVSLPVYGHDDIGAVADFILRRYRLKVRGGETG